MLLVEAEMNYCALSVICLGLAFVAAGGFLLITQGEVPDIVKLSEVADTKLSESVRDL